MVHRGLGKKNIPEFQTAHAILLLSGKYVLQLRDNIPTISAPGQWSFFGGKVEKGESPLQAVKREVYEEVSLKPKRFLDLWPIDFYSEFDKTIVRSWLFTAKIDDVWPERRLREGKDVKAFDFDELAKIEMPQAMREALIDFHEKRMLNN